MIFIYISSYRKKHKFFIYLIWRTIIEASEIFIFFNISKMTFCLNRACLSFQNAFFTLYVYKVSSTYVQKILYKNVQLFWLSDIVLYPVWATINTNYMWMVKNSIQNGISYHSIIKYAIPIRKVYICSQYSALLFVSHIN